MYSCIVPWLYKKIACTAIIVWIIVSLPVEAYNYIDPIYTRVLGSVNPNGLPFNLSSLYGGNPVIIGYTIPVTSFSVNIGGNTIHIDYEAAVKEAIKEWTDGVNRVNPNSQIEFRQNYSPNTGISFLLNAHIPLSPSHDYPLGVTRYTHNSNNTKRADQISLFYNNLTINVRQYYSKLVNTNILSATVTKEIYYKILLKFVLKHEIGHALGLEHPETLLSRQQMQSNQISVAANYIMIEPETAEYNPPSIMVRNVENYIYYLSLYYNRAINIYDVAVSESDSRAVSRLVNGDTQALASLHSTLAYQQFGANNFNIDITNLYSSLH